MVSPARAHFQRVKAAEAAASAAPGRPMGCTEYDLMLLKLAEDNRRLKGIQSMETRADIKRKLLPDYAPWVDGVLAAGNGGKDDVLMVVMLWRIDAGEYASALDIADYAIRHKLTMPDRFARTAPTVIAEELADAAKRARDGKAGFDLEQLQRAIDLTDDQDMPDEVRAKLYKELGLLLEAINPSAALAQLTRAKQLHDKVGVVKDIERIQKTIKNDSAGQSGGS